MQTEFNVLVDNAELKCDVIYSRYRDNDVNEAEIVIDDVFCDKISVIELVEEKEMENLKQKCEKHYNNQQLHWMQERDNLKK